LLKKWLREPLIHFLFIGGLLFVIYGLQNDGISDQSKRIVFSKADINRIALLWEKQRQRPPSRSELKGLIEQQIREQVLYREALAMGLDKNDSIVRRRLAQKVEFISSDLAAQVEPTEKDLADYLASHSEKFALPARIDFIHIYFNTDKRGTMAEADASHLLNQLSQTTTDIDITTAGDNIMMGQQHHNISEFEVSRLFGKAFAKEIFTFPVGGWQGPVASGYGFHLVRIDKKSASSKPELATVRGKVRDEWARVQRLIVDKAFYQGLRQRYEIVIEDVELKSELVSQVKK